MEPVGFEPVTSSDKNLRLYLSRTHRGHARKLLSHFLPRKQKKHCDQKAVMGTHSNTGFPTQQLTMHAQGASSQAIGVKLETDIEYKI